MDIGVYYVDSIPSRPITCTVMDASNNPADLSMYSDIAVRMVGSDNEEIDLSGYELTTNAKAGRVTFYWPKGRSVFTKPGEYVFQLRLSNPQVRDFTSERAIYVRELGGKR